MTVRVGFVPLDSEFGEVTALGEYVDHAWWVAPLGSKPMPVAPGGTWVRIGSVRSSPVAASLRVIAD